jgi:hypothetical protein
MCDCIASDSSAFTCDDTCLMSLCQVTCCGHGLCILHRPVNVE